MGLSHRASRWEGEHPRDAATTPVRPKKRRAPRGLRLLPTPAKRWETPLLRTPPGDVLEGVRVEKGPLFLERSKSCLWQPKGHFPKLWAAAKFATTVGCQNDVYTGHWCLKG